PLAVLCVQLRDSLQRDVFSLFEFRGLGRHELLHRIRRARPTFSRKDARGATGSGAPSAEQAPIRPPLDSSFWRLRGSVSELRYTLRADELPASLLRRLDSLPLGSLTTAAELGLEDAYVNVARRAQGLGLSFS
ncbi:MAG: hypothetical protein KDD44_06820, partial [Bdellovibrionales bacterium]|nr:hypothetical protein [Bdellovibrionales bacterium]